MMMTMMVKWITPGTAWLWVFLPAFVYFGSTRLSSSSNSGAVGGILFGRELGQPIFDSNPDDVETILQIIDRTHCSKLEKILYLTTTSKSSSYTCSNMELRYVPHMVQVGFANVVDIVWRHDSELGRGYLLISDRYGSGRIWRFEVGGGPIAIGRTLFLEDSGCRSRQHCPKQPPQSPSSSISSLPHQGSGAMAIDYYSPFVTNDGDKNSNLRSDEGALTVLEYGEQRIARLENHNGARTPLVLDVPCRNSNHTHHRIGATPAPVHMIYTPSGNLWWTMNEPEGCVGIYELEYAVHVKPLESLLESRQAHSWNSVRHPFSISAILANDASIQRLGGMVTTHSSVYLTAFQTKQIVENGGTKVSNRITTILKIPIEEDVEIDNDDDEDTSNKRKYTSTSNVKSLFDITNYTTSIDHPSAITRSEAGTFFVSVDYGILLIQEDASSILGRIRLPETPVALALGGDHYLYAASPTRLYRLRTRETPVLIPTQLVRRPPKAPVESRKITDDK
jgi:hypothetical protein